MSNIVLKKTPTQECVPYSLNTYYFIGTSPTPRLIWINRIGRVYLYDKISKDFIPDDLADTSAEHDWRYYSRIVAASSTNLQDLLPLIEKAHRQEMLSEFLDLLTLPIILMNYGFKIFILFPLKKIFRKIK